MRQDKEDTTGADMEALDQIPDDGYDLAERETQQHPDGDESNPDGIADWRDKGPKKYLDPPSRERMDTASARIPLQLHNELRALVAALQRTPGHYGMTKSYFFEVALRAALKHWRKKYPDLVVEDWGRPMPGRRIKAPR